MDKKEQIESAKLLIADIDKFKNWIENQRKDPTVNMKTWNPVAHPLAYYLEKNIPGFVIVAVYPHYISVGMGEIKHSSWSKKLYQVLHEYDNENLVYARQVFLALGKIH